MQELSAQLPAEHPPAPPVKHNGDAAPSPAAPAPAHAAPGTEPEVQQTGT
jgi:hypothetical protein